MRKQFTTDSFHIQVVEDIFPQPLNNADSMLLFALLHTHQINLEGTVILDAPSVRTFAAITQRHCAECLANRWRGKVDDRSTYTYWYWAWNTAWSYERIDTLEGDELYRFNAIKCQMEAHPAIKSLTLEGIDSL